MNQCEKCGAPLQDRTSASRICPKCQKSWRKTGPDKRSAEAHRPAIQSTLVAHDAARFTSSQLPHGTLRPAVENDPKLAATLAPENTSDRSGPSVHAGGTGMFRIDQPDARTKTDDKKVIDTIVYHDSASADGPNAIGQSVIDTRSTRDTNQPTPRVSKGRSQQAPTSRTDHPVSSDLPYRILAHKGVTGPQPADYEILEKIGEGGMGVVYRATQRAIQRDVAIKQIKAGEGQSAQQRDKFVREAQFTGELAHPNIVPIHDLGLDETGNLFYAMKIVGGQRWEKAILEKSRHENLEILLRVCDAIAFAHSRSIIHRDLKPENVMLGDFGEVLVMDWGLAAKVGDRREMTPGGSPAYMAPEMAGDFLQLIGKYEGSHTPHVIGKHSDIYLLGAILFEIITGKPPHDSGGTHGSQQAIIDCLHNSARNVFVQVEHQTDSLLPIALHAMATNPTDRFDSVAAFQKALREYQEHSQSIALADRAEQELRDAEANSGYEHYSRSLIGFQDALELWPDNRRAQDGVRRARLAYATAALQASDFELGLSLLDPKNNEDQHLYQRLERGARQRDQRERRIYVARITTAAMLLIAVGAMAIGWYTTNQARLTADSERRKADQSATQARAATERATKAADIAQQARNAAEKSAEELRLSLTREQQATQAAVEAERIATEQKVIAQQALRDARRERFAADVALAAQLVENDPLSARTKLAALQADDTAQLSIPVDWEWQRLLYRTHPEVRDIIVDGRSPRVAISADGAIATSGVMTKDGPSFIVWDVATQTERHPFNLPPQTTSNVAEIVGLAISGDSQLAIAAINVADPVAGSSGAICVWDIASGKFSQLEQSFRGISAGESYRIVHSAISADRQSLVTVHKGLHFTKGIVWEVSKEGLKPVADWQHSSVDAVSSMWHNRFLYARMQRLAGKPPVPQLFLGSVTLAPRAGVAFQSIPNLDADDPITSVTIAPIAGDAMEYAIGRASGAIVVASVDDPTKIATRTEFGLFGHRTSVTALQYSLDGKTLISADALGNVVVWDRLRRQVRQSLPGHRESVESMQLDHANALVTADRGGHLRFWNTMAYRDMFETVAVPGSDLEVSSLSPDGGRIAIADRRGVIQVQSIHGDVGPIDLIPGHLVNTVIRKAEYDASSARLFTWSDDGNDTFCVWDVHSGHRLRRGTNINGNGLFAVTPGGRFAVTAMRSESAKETWELRFLAIDSGEVVRRIADSFGEITSLAVIHHRDSTEGQYVAIGYSTGTVRIVDTIANRQLAINRRDDRDAGPIKQLLVAEDGQSIISIGENQKAYQLCEWSMASNRSTQLIGASDDSGDLLRLWRTVWERNLADPNEARYRLALRGNTLYVARCGAANHGGSEHLVIRTLEGDRGFQGTADASPFNNVLDAPPRDITVSPEGTIYALKDDRHVVRWLDGSDPVPVFGDQSASVETSGILATGSDTIVMLGATPLESRLASSGVFLRGFGGRVVALHWSTDGKVLVTNHDDGVTRRWEAATGQLIHQLTPDAGHKATLLVRTDDDASLASTIIEHQGTSRLVDWKLQAEQPVAKVRLEYPVRIVAIDNRQKTVAAIGDDRQVYIWRDGQLKKLRCKETDRIVATSLALSPDANRLAVGNDQGVLYVYRIAEEGGATDLLSPTAPPLVAEQKVVSPRRVPVPFTRVAFSPAGGRILTGDESGSVTLWFFPMEEGTDQVVSNEMVQGKELLTFPSHTRAVLNLEFSGGDAPSLLSSDGAGAKVWFASKKKRKD